MRYVLEYLGYHKETKRLWISSMTEKSIREGFDSLKSSKEFDNLYRAAKSQERIRLGRRYECQPVFEHGCRQE